MQAPAYYKFDWAVKDDYYNDFGQYEAREGDKTTGNYWVVLPDGRKQNVNYYVDGYSGYVADVTYDGYAKAYEPSYKAPAYKSYEKPAYSAPAYPAYKPAYSKPTYSAPSYKAPHYEPEYKEEYKTPEY